MLDNLGGKAYHLSALKEFCNVPDFFVIKAEEFDAEGALAEFDKRGFENVSVRSSATCEDGKNSSFAGMFESVLNVNRDYLIDAIQRVFASATGERAETYCKLSGVEEKPNMRVIVQKMVDSRISGVCFTKMSENRERLMIEACLGLGEALVSGVVTPDNYIVNRNTLETIDFSIGFQKTMLCCNGYTDVVFHKRNCKKLLNSEIKTIAEVALDIEARLRFAAADVEWAFEDNEMFILQAREYTGL